MDGVLKPLSTIDVQGALDSRVMDRTKLHGKTSNVDSTAKDFTAMFMAQMLQPMFDSVGVNDVFGGGHGEELMRGFLVQEYGKAVSQGYGSSLSDAVKKDMLLLQEKAQGTRL